MSLQALADQIRNCQLCPLAEGRTHAVPGEGAERADVIIIGEAPGREEDAQGRPFVGRAGRLLTTALEAAGLHRSDVFITNVVKCRPPENRPPTLQERTSCTQTYLVKQIGLVQPKLIVLLGNTAAQALLGLKSAGKVHGKVTRSDGHMYFCTYHPAAVLYDAALEDTFTRHMKLVRQILRQPNRYLIATRATSLDQFVEGGGG